MVQWSKLKILIEDNINSRAGSQVQNPGFVALFIPLRERARRGWQLFAAALLPCGAAAVTIKLAPKALKDLFPTSILFQTTFWGQVKARIGWEPRAFDISHAGGRSDVLLLNQPFAGNRIAAYIPHGP